MLQLCSRKDRDQRPSREPSGGTHIGIINTASSSQSGRVTFFEKRVRLTPAFHLFEPIGDGQGIEMLLNRRTSLSDRRRPCRRIAKIKYYPGSLPRDCVVTDVSERSVKVVVEEEDKIPGEFTLIFSNGRTSLCRLRWRNGLELGAEFIDPVGRRRRQRRWPASRK